MAIVEMICLANSRKHGGRCVAGLRIDGGGWIRPIGRGPDGTLFHSDYRLADNTEPRVLDVLRLELADRRPVPHQPENWVIGSSRWRLVERPASLGHLCQLHAHLTRGPELFGNCEDRVASDLLARSPAQQSLALVHPEGLMWHITTAMGGKRQTRAFFKLHRRAYDLAITDPVWEQHLSNLVTGYHPLDTSGLPPDHRILLTISLGEPFRGACFKLAAAVIELPHEV